MNEPEPELPEDIEHLSYRDLLQKYKDELRYFHFERKTEMVRRLAQKLREEGIPQDKISATLIYDLRGYDIHPDTIRSALGEEFKQNSRKREKFALKIRANISKNISNNDKIPIELSATGDPIIGELELKPEQEPDPEPEFDPDIPIKLPDLAWHQNQNEDIDYRMKYEEEHLRAGRLEEMLGEQREQIKSLVESVNKQLTNKKDKDKQKIEETPEYKAIESELIIIKQERDEYKQVASQQMKAHPEQTFQSAATIPQTNEEPKENSRISGDLEVEFPGKELSTFFMDVRNVKNIMYLQIKGNKVTGWQSDYAREKAAVRA